MNIIFSLESFIIYVEMWKHAFPLWMHLSCVVLLLLVILQWSLGWITIAVLPLPWYWLQITWFTCFVLTCQYLQREVSKVDLYKVKDWKEHLRINKVSHIYKYLQGLVTCLSDCFKDCFKTIDLASTAYDLKIKEALHILWEKPTLILNTLILNTLTPSFHSNRPLFMSASLLLQSHSLS